MATTLRPEQKVETAKESRNYDASEIRSEHQEETPVWVQAPRLSRQSFGPVVAEVEVVVVELPIAFGTCSE